MAVRMEKVAALRRLFAEYGYAPTGADAGMDKAAANRLTKFMNRTGSEGFGGAFGAARRANERALVKAHDARMRSIGIDNSFTLSTFDSSNSHERRHLYDVTAQRLPSQAARIARNNKMRALTLGKAKDLIAQHRRSGGRTSNIWDRLVPTLNWARRAKGLSDIDPRLQVFDNTLKLYDMSRNSGGTGKFAARYTGTGRSLLDVLFKYVARPEPGVLPVKPSKLTPELLIQSLRHGLSKHRIARMSDGLIDLTNAGWRGVKDLTGKWFGKSLYDGENVFLAGNPVQALPYVFGYPGMSFDRDSVPPDMLAGLLQSKLIELGESPQLLSEGRVKPNRIIYGPHISSFGRSIKGMYDEIRLFRDFEKQMSSVGQASPPAMGYYRNGVPATENASRYEGVLTKLRPGGENTYVVGGGADIYTARQEDMLRARDASNAAAAAWQERARSSEAINNMARMGYTTPGWKEQILAHPGIRLAVQS